jgi:hypothetical protein
MDPNFFGAPRTGAHAIRIPVLDIALVDTALTAVAAYWLSQQYGWSVEKTFIGLFALGVAAHSAVGVKTGFLQLVGL